MISSRAPAPTPRLIQLLADCHRNITPTIEPSAVDLESDARALLSFFEILIEQEQKMKKRGLSHEAETKQKDR